MTNDDVTSKAEGRQPTAASDRVLVDINEIGNTEFYHVDCGKVWYEKQGDNSPNYCPGCGKPLFEVDTDD